MKIGDDPLVAMHGVYNHIIMMIDADVMRSHTLSEVQRVAELPATLDHVKNNAVPETLKS